MSAKRLFACLIFSNSALLGVERYVSPSGNDSNTGSMTSPWKTFQKATSGLAAGDTLFLRAGTYAERLILNEKSGTQSMPINIRPFGEEIAVIDGSSLTVPSGGRQGLVAMLNCSNITLERLQIRNFETNVNSRIPVGLQIEGSGTGITVKECKVHHIWQTSTNPNSNGFGISVYGTKPEPLDGLILDSNEVFDLRTGQSESVVINGNVTNFTVARNHVYNCNNIGIDFIGYEGSAPAAVDRARKGICSENVVHGVDSRFNPGYGGNFTSGGGDGSAAGIYVDGGTDILITRNRVYGCNFGIELASENATGFTDKIRMTNNLLHHNLGPGIIMGGYDSNRGKTRECLVSNNTLYKNDTTVTYGGQIALQFYLEDNMFINNVIWANETTKQMIIHYVEGGNAAKRAFPPGNVFDYNVYYCEGESNDIEFGLNPTGSGGNQGNKSYNGLPAWRAISGSDANSSFVNPSFAVAVPSATPETEAFRPAVGSPLIDGGKPGPGYTPAPGETDFAGSSRLANGRVDVGCFEFMTGLQSWRDLYFRLPDGGPGAGDLDDPDSDGVRNLVEYSQGMNPTIPDPQLAPSGSRVGETLQFSYKKEASELTYAVQTSDDLIAWTPTEQSEIFDESGSYRRDFSLTPGSFFVRLKVQP